MERQDIPQHLQELGQVVGRPERPGEERHRQDDHVDDCGDRLPGADQRRDREPEPGERGGAEHERDAERKPVLRQLCVEETETESHDDERLEHDDEQVREQRHRQVERRRQRRRPEPLQDPELAADHEHDREAAERGVRDGVGDQAGDQVGRGRNPVPGSVSEDRREQEEEERREEEDEDRRLAAAPERQLLPLQLMPEKRHFALLGDELEVDVLERRPPHLERLPARRRPRAPAAVSSCSVRVGSSVSTTISSPPAR